MSPSSNEGTEQQVQRREFVSGSKYNKILMNKSNSRHGARVFFWLQSDISGVDVTGL